jgi:hypothetical protein
MVKGNANLTYHVRTGRLTGTVGGKVINSSALLPVGGSHGAHAGKYVIAPSHTDARLGLCAVLTAVRPAMVTIDFSALPARNALAEVTIDFLRSPAVNSLAAHRPVNATTITFDHLTAANALAGKSSAFVMHGSKDLMQAIAAAGGGFLEIVA